MNITLSSNLIKSIDNAVKTSSWREKTYDMIDSIRKNGKPGKSELYFIQNNVLDDDFPIKQYLRYYNSGKDSVGYNLYKQITDSLYDLFKNTTETDEISYSNETNIRRYIHELIANIKDPHPENNLEYFGEELISIIGEDNFKSWANEYNPQNLITLMTKSAEESAAKYDTHRYSNDTLSCFLKATTANNIPNAISECRDNLLKLEASGMLVEVNHTAL
jgi:hypothetical protein